MQLTDIQHHGVLAGRRCKISQVKCVAEQVVLFHDILFYSNNTQQLRQAVC